jgi:hypothetical protein
LSRLIDLLWRKERATPAQVALLVFLLLAPTLLLVQCPGTPEHVTSFSGMQALADQRPGGPHSIWMPGQFSSVLGSWLAIIGPTSVFAVIVRHARFGVTRPPELRVAYWTLPPIVLLFVELQCGIRLFRLSQEMGSGFSWICAPIVLATGAVLVVLAFLASRRGPTSGLFALALGEWIAGDVSTVLGSRADLWYPGYTLLDLGLFAVTAFVLTRVETKPDDLPRAGLGWAAQPADVILAPWAAGWLAIELVILRALIAETHVAADPLSSTSVSPGTMWTAVAIVQQTGFWLFWVLAIPALAKWIAWTRAHAPSPEPEPVH